MELCGSETPRTSSRTSGCPNRYRGETLAPLWPCGSSPRAIRTGFARLSDRNLLFLRQTGRLLHVSGICDEWLAICRDRRRGISAIVINWLGHRVRPLPGRQDGGEGSQRSNCVRSGSKRGLGAPTTVARGRSSAHCRTDENTKVRQSVYCFSSIGVLHRLGLDRVDRERGDVQRVVGESSVQRPPGAPFANMDATVSRLSYQLTTRVTRGRCTRI
jgi:hypothetical protein